MSENPLEGIGRQVREINRKIIELKTKGKIDLGLSAGYLFSAGLYKFIEINNLPTPTIPVFSGNEVLFSLILSGYSISLGFSRYAHARDLKRFNMFGQRILYVVSDEKSEK